MRKEVGEVIKLTEEFLNAWLESVPHSLATSLIDVFIKSCSETGSKVVVKHILKFQTDE